jgi:hypothetical protein
MIRFYRVLTMVYNTQNYWGSGRWINSETPVIFDDVSIISRWYFNRVHAYVKNKIGYSGKECYVNRTDYGPIWIILKKKKHYLCLEGQTMGIVHMKPVRGSFGAKECEAVDTTAWVIQAGSLLLESVLHGVLHVLFVRPTALQRFLKERKTRMDIIWTLLFLLNSYIT